MFWLMLAASLCSPQDPDFRRYAYPEHIAICRRSVDAAEKRIIAERDAITDWSMVEFDHRIPLCAGGSEQRQKRGEDRRPSFWADPYKSVPLFLGVPYGAGLLIVYLTWRFYWRPRYEDGGDNGKRRKRDEFE